MEPKLAEDPPDFSGGVDLRHSLKEIPARRGFSVSCGGKTLLSRIDPVAQAERLAAEISARERTLYFCPSPLYGYGLSRFLEKLPETSAVLCAEAGETLFELSLRAFNENETLKQPQSSCVLTRASDAESLCAFARKTWGTRVFRRVEVIRLTGGWQIFPELYDGLALALRNEIALEWGNAMTLIRLGRLYARNLVRNVRLLGESEDTAALNFASFPVLALGAGPSLDPILAELSALWKGKIPAPENRPFRIVCVDTCLPALNERGILPDLAVILESQHWNLRDFAGVRQKKIDAALDLSALPASAEILGGKRYFFSTVWTELALFGRMEKAGLLPETFAPLGSVGLSAVALALRISRGPVVSGGIDFSYTLDAYHARSTPGHADLLRRQNRFLSVVNADASLREKSFSAAAKNGKAVRSDPAMRNYRALFEREFGGNPRLLDIDGSGLNLGVKIISPAQAFEVLRGGSLGSPRSGGTASGGSSGGARDDLPARGVQPSARGAFPAEPETLAAFISGEMNILAELRETLSGGGSPAPDRLGALLDAADYLWAHFPECAGAGGRRPALSDTSFLKRVRTEIEPFLKLWKMSLDAVRPRRAG